MRGVTIRQLQIFAAAAGHLSFARTSEQLHLTQAAVSLQIKQLEEHAGIALFERRGRKLHLTEAGEHLVRYAQQILDALKDADAAISALKGLRGGRISVGVVSTAKYFAPALLARFQQRHPGRERHAVGEQPRSHRPRARAQRDRRRDHGHAAAADRNQGGALRRPSAGDHRAAGAPARAARGGSRSRRSPSNTSSCASRARARARRWSAFSPSAASRRRSAT